MDISYLASAGELEELKKNHAALVVDFYSDECPPCEKLAPLYEQMAKSFPSVKFIKVFRQEQRDLAVSLGVSGSPTVLFFKDGELTDKRLAGDIAEADFKEIMLSLYGEISLVPDVTDKKVEEFDLCIVGNGPAGLTAAVYAARYGIKQVVVGELPGGLMMSSHKICNFPSVVEISGAELTQRMLDQIEALGVPQKFSGVSLIKQAGDRHDVVLSNGQVIRAKAVLLATGTKHRHLGLPNEKELVGRGVSYCATCDAMFYKGKTVAVIGGGDSANTAALYLAQVADKVYQVYRGESLRGETAWIDQIKANDKITVIYNTQVSEIIGQETLAIDGLFIEVGSEPDPIFIEQLALETDNKYIVTKSSQLTSRAGIWAAGDITTNSDGFRQIITACSEGAVAAQSIFSYLQANN
jgi:thioredoxin reductase (NADPH)